MVDKAHSHALTTQAFITVPFHDVDPMGIVWHGHYAKYFEVARCALLDQLGYGYRQMATSKHAWPVIDMKVRYVQPVEFEQNIVVTATLAEWDLRLLVRYKIHDADDGRRLTKGSTTQVAVDPKDQSLVLGIPDEFRGVVERAIHGNR